jgi:hypothetical protein
MILDSTPYECDELSDSKIYLRDYIIEATHAKMQRPFRRRAGI